MSYASPTTINMSKGFGEVLIYVNSVTNNWLSNMIMLGIYIILLMGYYKARNDFAGAMAVSGWVTFVVGLLFWAGGFISGWILSISFGMALIGVLFLLLDN